MSGSAQWRPMGQGDVDAAAAISDRVHGAYTEKPAIYAERLRLYPAGCFLLEGDGQVLGYLVTHPWAGDRPPALDQLMGRLPDAADRYYLHDLALLPEARGTGAAAAAVDLAVAQARAVHGGQGDAVEAGGDRRSSTRRLPPTAMLSLIHI